MALLPFKKPLIFLDLEATGVDPEMDRIVEICMVKSLPAGGEEVFLERVNPGISIPPESSAIHGIRDMDVREKPFFRALAPSVAAFIGEGDLAGYNILRYDAPLLAAEISRSGLTFSLRSRSLVDVMKIYHRKEPRDLSAAYRFYCGKDLTQAHTAEADCRATADIFFSQMEKYPDLPREIPALHEWCGAKDPRFVDTAGRFAWRYGEAYFNFGKHKGKALAKIARQDPEYITWLLQEGKLQDETWAICQGALEGQFPKKNSS